jgi:acyl-coenzyme A synthetase/AMP-(fatty) acid ligase
LICDSPVTGTVRVLTFHELLSDVAAFAGALARIGIVKGDRIIIYMPMIPEAVIVMRAVARLGAIHSVVFGGSSNGTTRSQARSRTTVCAGGGDGSAVRPLHVRDDGSAQGHRARQRRTPRGPELGR